MSTTTPEGKVKEQVKKILKQAGAWYFMPVSTGYGKHGVPDFLVCWKGKFIAIECKATEELKPTALQEIQLRQIEEAGGVVMVVYPGGMDQLEAVFR